MHTHWNTKAGVLQIGGIGVDALAAQFDTPSFITDAARIAERYQTLASAFADHPTTIAYACKANTSLAIMQLLLQCGSSIDAVSLGEVEIALHAGFPAERIYFTGTNPRTDHLQRLLDLGVHINIDSLSIAQRIAPLAKHYDFGLRINPSVGAGHHEHVNTGAATSKFGLQAEDLEQACSILAEHGHRVVRLHAHIGSGIHEADPFLDLLGAMHRHFQSIEHIGNVAIRTIDIGGGFGIPYQPDDDSMDVARVATKILQAFQGSFPAETELLLEPGRWLVGDSTILLSRATSLKPSPQRHYVGLDTGMHQLLRPALYQSYHHIVVAERMDAPAQREYCFTGPICESADVLGADRVLPEIHEGDLIAICDAGAYGMSMASTYNSNTLPAEVLVIDGEARCIRKRGTVEDLLRGQVGL